MNKLVHAESCLHAPLGGCGTDFGRTPYVRRYPRKASSTAEKAQRREATMLSRCAGNKIEDRVRGLPLALALRSQSHAFQLRLSNFLTTSRP